MNIDYNLLGFSPATVSMLLEAVTSIHDKPLSVGIVQNREVSDDLEFAARGVELSMMFIDGEFPEKLENCALGVYRPSTKKTVYEYFSDRIGELLFLSVVHPDASVASSVTLRRGIFVNPNVTLAPFCTLDDFVTVNRNASVGHHTELGSFVTVNPGAHIAGHCKIGHGVAIGMGASVVEGISIGDGSIIGAGSVVTRDIPAGVKALGAPCKVVETL